LLMQEMVKTAPPPLAKVEDVPLLDVAEADVAASAASASERTDACAFNLRLVYIETAFQYLSLSLWHGKPADSPLPSAFARRAAQLVAGCFLFLCAGLPLARLSCECVFAEKLEYSIAES